MSIVVWDGKVLAADRQSLCAGLATTASKMSMKETPNSRTVLAFIGGDSNGRELIDWFWAGAKKEDWPKCQDDNEPLPRLIIATRNGCYFFEQQPILIPVLDPFAAWGSGRDFAYGALEMGADAVRAVEVTCKHSVECGRGVEVYAL